MTDYEVIDHDTGELLPAVIPAQPVNLFGVDDPSQLIDRAREHARALADVIEKQHLYADIQGRPHVLVEGWTLLGSMLGVFPVVAWTRPIDHDGKAHGWEARVEAKTLAGQVVGAAEAQCTRDENAWSHEPTGRNGRKLQPRDDFALRSMAQTRATSKALRGPLGFIVQLAGYNPTPAEEMPADDSARANVSGDDGRAETAAQETAEAPPSPPAPPEPSAPVISEQQLRKLWATWRDTGIPDVTLKDLLRDRFGVESTKQIPKSRFNELLSLIGDLDAIPF